MKQETKFLQLERLCAQAFKMYPLKTWKNQ